MPRLDALSFKPIHSTENSLLSQWTLAQTRKSRFASRYAHAEQIFSGKLVTTVVKLAKIANLSKNAFAEFRRMPTKNVNLTEHYAAFVEQLVESGQYKNASEVFREGLRLLEHARAIEEQKLATLRRLAKKGFDSLDQGSGIELHSEKEIRSHIANLGRKAEKNA